MTAKEWVLRCSEKGREERNEVEGGRERSKRSKEEEEEGAVTKTKKG